MRILVICDDYWHPGDVVKAGLEPLKDHGMEFIYTEDMSDFELSGMTGYPVVILSKSNNISSSSTKEWATEEAQKFFDRYVSKGGGLLAIHSGTADYRMRYPPQYSWRSIYITQSNVLSWSRPRENMLLPGIYTI